MLKEHQELEPCPYCSGTPKEAGPNFYKCNRCGFGQHVSRWKEKKSEKELRDRIAYLWKQLNSEIAERGGRR